MNVSGQFPRYAASIAAPHAGGLSLLQIRDFVTRQWRLVALVTALAIIVGIAYLALTPRKYTAQTDMIIDTKRVSFSQSELATENRIVEDASVESEIETTKSEKVAGVVAKRLQLVDDPEFVGSGESLKQRIFSLIWSTAPAPEPSSEEILRGVTGQLKANLRVTRLGRSYIEQIALHFARSEQGRAESPTLSPMPISRTSCRRSSKPPVAPASGWSNGSESCASRRATRSRRCRTSNPSTASSLASTASCQ